MVSAVNRDEGTLARGPELKFPDETATQLQNQAVAISVEAAARMLNISRSLAWNLVWEGKLRSVKLGRRRVVPLGAIQELLEQPTPQTESE